jgi:hypothetical protein
MCPPAPAMTWPRLANMARWGVVRCSRERTTVPGGQGLLLRAHRHPRPNQKPTRHQVLDPNNRCYNSLLTRLRSWANEPQRHYPPDGN